MPKVVTSEGIKDFVDSKGTKPTEVFAREERKAPGAAPPMEMKGNAPPADPPEMQAPESKKEEAKPVADEGLEAEDHDLAERAKKRIGKKHYEMKGHKVHVHLMEIQSLIVRFD